jgi:hypothetical protein
MRGWKEKWCEKKRDKMQTYSIKERERKGKREVRFRRKLGVIFK